MPRLRKDFLLPVFEMKERGREMEGEEMQRVEKKISETLSSPLLLFISLHFVCRLCEFGRCCQITYFSI
jgi:hypothetical protein